MQETITVPTASEQDFLKFVAKMNKKANRFGVPNLFATRLDETERMAHRKVYTIFEGEETERDVTVKVVDYTLDGSLFQLEGWAFVATVEHTPAGNLFSKAIFSREIEVPERYLETSHKLCEHCGVKRQRNFTFIIHHSEKGFKQVGSTCLKDFLGGHSVKGFEFAAVVVNKISEFVEGECFGKAKSYDPLIKVLTVSCAEIRRNGFVSARKAEEEYLTPTKEFVKQALWSREESKVTDEDVAQARKVADWMATLPRDKGEYLQKLSIIGELGYVSPRNVGLVCSAPAALDREVAKQKESDGVLNEHYGNVGDKLTFGAEVVSVRPCDTQYGTSFLYLFKSGTGHMFKWFASRNQHIEQGQTVAVKGTVKAHDEWNGKKQTALTRCKILDNGEQLS